jgi:diketogulonate reductase-like aldo/keto reductase
MQERIERVLQHKGMTVPTFLYGTAWKENRTQGLVEAALANGFRGIDTANQRRHYYEKAAGEAVRLAIGRGSLKRSDLFLQTKFTYAAGQDHRLPFDPRADYSAQVRQSLASSLDHLHTDYVDSFILHGPATLHAFNYADQEVWRTMEQLNKEGVVKSIGVSNVGFDQLTALLEFAHEPPAFVQNRCFARSRWDARIRELCKANGIIYQGFSLLTANATEVDHAQLHAIAGGLNRTLAQVVFRFCLQVGMLPLTGTTSTQHMQEDLEIYDFQLSPSEIKLIENIAFM